VGKKKGYWGVKGHVFKNHLVVSMGNRILDDDGVYIS
jgi:hypothetical protein